MVALNSVNNVIASDQPFAALSRFGAELTQVVEVINVC